MQIATRSNTPACRRGLPAESVRDGAPLFRRTGHRKNSYIDHRAGTSSSTRVGGGASGSLQAMRQFAAEASASAVAASSPAAAVGNSRPRTTGSVHQFVAGGGGGSGEAGGRRQSTGSMLAVSAEQPQQQRHANYSMSSSSQVAANGDNSTTSVRASQHLHQMQQQQQQQQQYRPRLTRNMTLNDLGSRALTGGISGSDEGFGYSRVETGGGGGGGGGGAGMGLLIQRGWQASGSGGPRGTGQNAGRMSSTTASHRGGLSETEGRPTIGTGGDVLGGVLSRLPMLESSGKDGGLMHQSSSAIENTELLEHGMSFGVSALKGRRPYMEDEYKVIPHLELTEGYGETSGEARERMEPTHFFGLFDGHAGGRCSKALTQILGQTVSREADFSLELTSAVKKGFVRANTEFLRKAERFCANDGSTAITAFVRGRRIVVGNVGDSRAVLCSDGRAVPLSSDHKPNKPEERRRIQALGGRVVYSFGIPRVNGILAVSRAFGDRNMKGSINAEPDVRERLLERGDEYLVLATDGVWDVMTSQEACNIVYNCAPDLGPQACSELLTATALRKGSMDNTSAMVVDLRGLWDSTERLSTPATARNGTATGVRKQLHSSSTSSLADVVRENHANSGGGGGGGERSRLRQSSAGAWVSQVSRNGKRDTSSSPGSKLTTSSLAQTGSGGGIVSATGGSTPAATGRNSAGRDVEPRRRQQQQQKQLRPFTGRRAAARRSHQYAGEEVEPVATTHAASRESVLQMGSGATASATGVRNGPLSPENESSEGIWAKSGAAVNNSKSKVWGMSIAPGSAWSSSGSGGGGGLSGYFSSAHQQHSSHPQHHLNSTELAMSLYGRGAEAQSRNRSPSPSRRN